MIHRIGNTTAYRNGCRCVNCKAAKLQAIREYRANLSPEKKDQRNESRRIKGLTPEQRKRYTETQRRYMQRKRQGPTPLTSESDANG